MRRLPAQKGLVRHTQAMSTSPNAHQVAVVSNPSKSSTDAAKEAVVAACSERGWPAPWMYDTTEEDPGEGQATAARERGAGVVIAAGGDGTVRAVAGGLEGSDVALGIVPLGTGNLLARNLNIPLTGPADSVKVALGARARRIDVAHLHLEGESGETADHVFLVGAGIGFDAVLMENTDDALKKRAGSLAYVAAGLKLWNLRRLLTTVTVDDATPVNLHTRSLIIGNCGYLQGGIALMPDAKPDDGMLDAAAIGTRQGVGGWIELGGAILLQSMGRRVRRLQRSKGPITHLSGKSIHVHAERVEAVQVDGDPVGHARVLTAKVNQRALLVRVP